MKIQSCHQSFVQTGKYKKYWKIQNMQIDVNTYDVQQHSSQSSLELTRIIMLQSGSFLSTYTSINKSPAWET